MLPCLVLFTACSYNSIRSQRPLIESTTVHNRPVTEPIRSITSFSGSLACMDTLLKEAHIPTTFIASKYIEDASGKASVGAKGMVITSLSQMSRTSQAFRVVDVEVDPLRQDTVQTLTNLLLPSGQMQIPMPSLYISGAISYLDQNVRARNKSLGVSNEDWEVGISNDVNTTAIGVELHIGDFISRTLYPGIDSANELVGFNKGAGIDGGAKINKTGVQFTLGDNISQGTGPAVRTLIELGMVELIGKWAQVPYWQCLSLDQTHPEFQRQLLSWFDGMSSTERTRFFQKGLKSLGYYSGGTDGKMTPQLKQALMLFQVDNQATPSGNVNFESYDRLLKHYVESDGKGDFTRIGWSDAPRNPIQYKRLDKTVIKGTSESIPAHQTPTVTLDLTLGKSTYVQGDTLLLNLSTSRLSYPYCFYEDARGNIAQIYPNQFQTVKPIQANRSVYVPDVYDPNTFSIELNTIGTEKLVCLATNDDVSQKINNVIGTDPLMPIAGVKTTSQLMDMLQQKLGEEIVGVQSIQWMVGRP